MLNIDKLRANKKLITEINALIFMGNKSVSDLRYYDLKNLISMIIDAESELDKFNFIVEPNNAKFIPQVFCKFLKVKEDHAFYENAKQILVDTMIANAIDYYQKDLAEIFNERIAINEQLRT